MPPLHSAPREAPRVAAVIATFNRVTALRTALNRLSQQSTPPAEILVVDDGSTDGTGAMVRSEFPHVRYTCLPHNAGLIFARNFGFVNSTGDYILSVDDDSWFVEDDGLARAIAFLEAHPDVAAVACNITTRDGLVYFPSGMPPFEAPWYVGCGHVLRRRAVAEVGLYLSEFYRQGEEKDRCLRLVDAGHRVMALPDVMVYHDKNTHDRAPGLVRYYDHRNDLIREIARCPARLLPWRLARTWAGNSWKNLRFGLWLTDVKLLLALPEILRIGWKHRQPVSLAAYRRWLKLAAEKPEGRKASESSTHRLTPHPRG